MRADQASGPPHRLPNRPPRRARGLSLVELMIGMLIGLLAVLLVFATLESVWWPPRLAPARPLAALRGFSQARG